VVVSARAHTEKMGVELMARLGWEPGQGHNVGIGRVGRLEGRVFRLDNHAQRQSFEYKFVEDVIVTPNCAVDPTTLKMRMMEAARHL
jgi:hypothetical protein